MRLIDVINNTSVVVAYQGDETFDEIVEKAIEATKRSVFANIKEIETVSAIEGHETGRWIPCNERLPKEDDYKPFSYYEDGAVLFCTKNGKIGFGWYYDSTKEWANEDDESKDVIAWMPLPAPYRKEGEKE